MLGINFFDSGHFKLTRVTPLYFFSFSSSSLPCLSYTTPPHPPSPFFFLSSDFLSSSSSLLPLFPSSLLFFYPSFLSLFYFIFYLFIFLFILKQIKNKYHKGKRLIPSLFSFFLFFSSHFCQHSLHIFFSIKFTHVCICGIGFFF